MSNITYLHPSLRAREIPSAGPACKSLDDQLGEALEGLGRAVVRLIRADLHNKWRRLDLGYSKS